MPDTPEAARPQTILAFDFGLRRIGVAVGQTVTGSASPLGIVDNREGRVDTGQIARLIREWRPDRLVVGMPLTEDGERSAMSGPVEAFVGQLEAFDLPVDTVDERYTSIEASRVLRDARAAGATGRISKDRIDSAAAVMIAERYLKDRGDRIDQP